MEARSGRQREVGKSVENGHQGDDQRAVEGRGWVMGSEVDNFLKF